MTLWKSLSLSKGSGKKIAKKLPPIWENFIIMFIYLYSSVNFKCIPFAPLSHPNMLTLIKWDNIFENDFKML